MPLDEAQQRHVSGWLASRAGYLICPVCSHEHFSIEPELLSLRPAAAFQQDDAPSAPAVAVVCNHCANIRLFSTAVMGLVLPPPPPRPVPPQAALALPLAEEESPTPELPEPPVTVSGAD
jgi:hypothetical protein